MGSLDKILKIIFEKFDDNSILIMAFCDSLFLWFFPRNSFKRGRLSTVDLLIKISEADFALA